MKKKKSIYIILIILLVLPILFFYNAFNGNPISKQISKLTIKNHLANTYPSDEFSISKPFYNFKDSGYNYDVTKIGDPVQTTYPFIITGVFGSIVHYDGIYYANQDTYLIEKLEKKASKEITSLLQTKIPKVVQAFPQLEILKGTYEADTIWTKDFEPERPMHLHLIIDARELSEEDLLQIAAEIQKTLNNHGYVYSSAMINANILSDEKGKDPFGYVKYAISFEKDTVLTLKMIQQFNN